VVREAVEEYARNRDQAASEPDVSEVSAIVGDISGKTAIIADDMITTGGTLIKAAEALLARGATEVYACATHAVFARDSIGVLDASAIRKIVVTDTIPHERSMLPPKFEVLPAAPILADALERISTNRSVSALFTDDTSDVLHWAIPHESALVS